MANTFKNYTSAAVGTGETTVMTVAASTTAVIIGLSLANITASQIAVDVKIGTIYIVKGVAIPANSAISVLDGKIIAETTETIKVTSGTASSCDVILSVLEQT
jgi:hypothetical protein